MRPFRRRNISLGVAALGALCVWWVTQLPADAQRGPIAVIVGAAGLTLAILGAAVAFFFHLDSRSLKSLLRGHRVIARWRVDLETWRAFIARNSAWTRQGITPNIIDLEQAVGPKGIEIVATTHSVLCGSDFHDISSTASGGVEIVNWISGEPPCVEICGRIQMKSSSSPFAIRIPVASDAIKPACDVHAAWAYHFQLIRKAWARNPVRARNISLAIFTAGVSSLAAALFWGGSSPVQVLLTASGWRAAGLIFGIFSIPVAGPLALRFHWSSRRYRGVLEGRDEIARWRLDAPSWRAFLQLEHSRRQLPDVPFNLVDIWRNKGENGIEILVAADAVMIDSELFDIRELAPAGVERIDWLETQPPCIELQGRYRTSNGSHGDFTVRFPVAPDAYQAGAKVWHAWRATFLAK